MSSSVWNPADLCSFQMCCLGDGRSRLRHPEITASVSDAVTAHLGHAPSLADLSRRLSQLHAAHPGVVDSGVFLGCMCSLLTKHVQCIKRAEGGIEEEAPEKLGPCLIIHPFVQSFVFIRSLGRGKYGYNIQSIWKHDCTI